MKIQIIFIQFEKIFQQPIIKLNVINKFRNNYISKNKNNNNHNWKNNIKYITNVIQYNKSLRNGTTFQQLICYYYI
jgi:hypothetical protein